MRSKQHNVMCHKVPAMIEIGGITSHIHLTQSVSHQFVAFGIIAIYSKFQLLHKKPLYAQSLLP